MAQNTGLDGLRTALRTNGYEPEEGSGGGDFLSGFPVPLKEVWTSDAEINGLRNLTPGSPPYEITYHHFNIDIDRSLMDDNSYGKAGKLAGQLTPTLALQAKAHRQQAAQIEATRKAQKKAAKKTKREWQQRRADISLALDSLADIAENGTYSERVVAANSLLSHYKNEY